MKLVIDIPEQAYNLLNSDEQIDWLDAEMILEVVAKGTPYEERPKGKWMYNFDWVNDEMQSEFYCSECKRGAYPTLDNYCPHCGAHMRGGKEE